jgi:hypothetical protein
MSRAGNAFSIRRTISEIIGTFAALPRVDLSVGFTLSAANVFEVLPVARWADLLDLPFTWGMVDHPLHLALDRLPRQVRHKAADHLLQALTHGKLRPRTHKEIAALARILEAVAADPSPADTDRFMAFMNDLDVSRRQSVHLALPQLVGALAEAGVNWDTTKSRFSVMS